jgi:hypothetical protein
MPMSRLLKLKFSKKNRVGRIENDEDCQLIRRQVAMTPKEMSKCHIETSGPSITVTFIMTQFRIEPGTKLKGIVTHYLIDSNGFYVSFLHPSQDPKHDLLLLISR